MKKLTRWCAFNAGGVIGPFFFFDENNSRQRPSLQGHNIRVFLGPTQRYKLERYVVPTGLGNVPYSIRCNRIIEDQVRRATHSTVLVNNRRVKFNLFRDVTSLVYANKSATLKELQANIERDICGISADCVRVMKN